MYAKFFKRMFDFTMSLLALIVLSPLLLILTLVGAVAMRGNPFFIQERPGRIDKRTGKEKIFKLIKFRTMDNRKNANGELLPDEVRLNRYGRFLRSTSLDELAELLNIVKGDMSIVGPRPLAVQYLPYYNEHERHRHDVRPGLTGLAQVCGRNATTWEDRFRHDLEYVSNISFSKDVEIMCRTVLSVVKRADIGVRGIDSPIDFDVYRKSQISDEVHINEYNR